ncbi:MAG: carboxylesterase family protein [Clostridiales bacterium]|nr:carboxylesterase family protein [Clostridiales bacterium]
MKRWIALLLALAMCLALVSCGGSTEDESAQGSETESTQAADSEDEEVPADEAEETESTDGEEDALIRTTQYGQVQGVDQDGVQVYYGIPYGADPVGELRWADPTAPESWDDVLDCTEQEEIALQTSNVYNSDGTVSTTLVGTTDCLNLDIYTTSDAENLPVLVYVHGGNNQTGSSYGEVVGNDLVVNDECVVVSLNYRTGLFGYNALPAITEEGTSGNYGLLDITFALQWVRDNISEFGGDASNVTVSGFSAGGRNVMAMLVSPAFEGLFDQAIVFSGGMTICDLDDAAQKDAEIMAPLVVEDGLAETEEEAAEWLMQDTDEVREYLYSIDADRMAEIMSDAGIRMANFPHLFGDDIVLPSSGFEGAEYVNDVPVIMLTGTTEFSLFAAFDGYFYAIEDEEVQNAARTFAISYGSDFYRIFNTQLSAETMYDSYNSDIYVVQVNYGGDDSASTIATFGAFHGIFVPMLSSTHNYGSFADFTGAGYTAMSEVFNAYLKNFLYTGDPNSDDTAVEWTTWDKDTMQTLVLDASEDTGEAIVEMQNVFKTNADIIAEIEADDTLDEEIKATIISTIMNGRWFSDDLDEYYNTPSLW